MNIKLSIRILLSIGFLVTTVAPAIAQNSNLQSYAPLIQPAVPPAWQAAVAPKTGVQVRIKDITSIAGHRGNRVQGLGLVTGLKGTGGKKSPLTQSLTRNMLLRFGVKIDEADITTGSLSVVTVTAEIPPFMRAGETINATVAAMDNPGSLYGGELQTTTLMGVDDQVYAIAGGALVVGGFSASGEGASIRKNHDTTVKVQARIEKDIYTGHAFPDSRYRLLLKNNDYTTALRIANEINRYFPNHASPSDSGSVDVYFPREYQRSKMDFVVFINNLRITPDSEARVVINQKTGTIVAGQDVRLSRIMIANDNLIITTSESPIASQPAPLSGGETVVLPRTQLTATETGGKYSLLSPSTTVGDLVAALNMLGVSPQDLISTLQTIQASGALHATLVIE